MGRCTAHPGIQVIMRINIPQTGELVLEVSAPFPGQVLAYNLKIAFYIPHRW